MNSVTYTLRSRVIYREADKESISNFISEYNELVDEYNKLYFIFNKSPSHRLLVQFIEKQKKIISHEIGNICMVDGTHFREYTDDRLINEEIYTERVNILNFGIDLIDLVSRYSYLFVSQLRKLQETKKILIAAKREMNKEYDDIQIRLDIEELY